ncbi:tRNA nucleotidyltransferase [Moesziomyces antarcticus]|uniref:tRNA nucleotidyltransferase n=2 Tax=Pseudozyma antarctica TaxID=84753 RepID=A0A081CNP8_PSEA2|nr:tRNA nucleotidyltransferase [Moesziomyces antarcticus]GAK68294.1 tRNA nucleotidyltransferase [Moesziomyces antarcticus]
MSLSYIRSCTLHRSLIPNGWLRTGQSSGLPRRVSTPATRLGSATQRLVKSTMRPDAQIQLTEQEETICQLLDHTCTYIQREKPEIEGVDATQRSGDESDPCEARIAGGWVRDKLLERDSDDLDISLSTLTGNAFALYLKHFLSSPSFSTSPLAQSPYFREDGHEMGRIGKIAANPEQSKNLETATARVLGLSLDFVNLRKETYDPGSRIPTMTFGTPKEDAERRDITINSLLYNVHSRQVEDHTGLGLQDLASGLIRTPLPPLTTFLDDPLRVLRCVRFASRFAYELHPAIIRCLTAAGDAETGAVQLASADDPRVSTGNSAGVESGRDQIRDALVSKVSRERFGIEVDKMLKGPNPLLALFLLHRLELFPLVFHPQPSAGKLWVASEPPLRREGAPLADAVALNAARLLDAILKQSTLDAAPINQDVAMHSLTLADASGNAEDVLGKTDLSREFSAVPASPLAKAVLEALPSDLVASWSSAALSSEEKRRLWISVALLPLRELVYEEKKNKNAWAGESVIATGLKLGTKTLKEPVTAMHKCLELLPLGRRALSRDAPAAQDTEALDRALHLSPGLSVRSRLGLLLRNPNVSNSMLQLRPQPALLLSFIGEAIELWRNSEESFNSLNANLGGGQDRIVELAREYAQFWTLVQRWNLVERADEKPLLDGNAVTACLGCHPRLISHIQTFVLAWQYDQPLSGPELEVQCSEWLKAEWAKGGIVPVDQRPPPPPSKADKAKKKPAVETPDRRKRQKSE